MSKRSKRKGYVGEKEFRDICEEAGLDAVWQGEDPKKPDVRVGDWDIEIKYRASVPKSVYDWLEEKDANALAMRRISTKDRGRDWLVVMRLSDFFETSFSNDVFW